MKILMIIAPENFRDEELLEPKEVFEENEYRVTIASKGAESSTGMMGAMVNIEEDISEVDVSEYRAVVFVGGSGSSVYFDDETVLDLAREAEDKCDVLGAICIAPSILANAGLLDGKKATSYSSQQENLEQNGAKYTGEPVEVDGKIVTASGPEAARFFGKKIIELLS